MEVTETIPIDATKDVVWLNLSDPEVLMTSIPGTTDISKVDDRTYIGTICRQVAGVTVSMDGELYIDEFSPPDRIAATITATDKETRSRIDGVADLSLTHYRSNKTVVDSTIKLNFSGKLASIGSRILFRKASSDIHTFFSNLEAKTATE